MGRSTFAGRSRGCVVKLLLIALIVLLGLSAPATTGPFEDGEIAFVREDYAAAERLWRPLAIQGNVEAQYSLGVMYHIGQGVHQDYAEALTWYRKASEQGFAAAQYQIGNMYLAGTGVLQDYTMALRWYRKAAEQGAPYAQRSIGLMYENGQGVPVDYAEAMKWYSKADNQANAAGAAPTLRRR
jgi:uncharacterized protein